MQREKLIEAHAGRLGDLPAPQRAAARQAGAAKLDAAIAANLKEPGLD